MYTSSIKIIYPIKCTCCDPAKLLKNYDARKYHLNNMAKKRTAVSESNDVAPPAPPANRASVNILVVLKSFLFIIVVIYLFIIF